MASLKLLVLCSVAGGIAGCSHVDVARNLHDEEIAAGAEPIAHVNASTWGIYLFNWIPIITGNSEVPEDFTLFEHTVDLDRVVGMLTRKSKELGATHTLDIQSFKDSDWQSGSLIFWMRVAHASGNAVRIPPASGPASASAPEFESGSRAPSAPTPAGS
jgi:hypothetical protein